ncbi:MAG: glutamine--fructose-6-phosphate transaminase (isomerizing) [Deltaproteobacteria bacterium]|jgi:glucosamine--fructose-6-phosphate aminotransferase (isomerizing)|nr:glutamine--fructose-6-phosphate transaminase (isomerizing) [Deltaproteobacteria bacterium]
MCGIIGYTGHRPAVPVVLEGLKRLEYRGYDSAGVGFVQNQELQIVRAAGKLVNLEDKLASKDVFLATSAIGHTRWATHGAPTEANAHPHRADSLCIAHNGIFENYEEYKRLLQSRGRIFSSETDTEVLAGLIASEREPGLTFLEAFARALRKAHGAYAVALMDQHEPDVIYAARHSAPLILGVGVGEHYVASDIPAFLPYTREVVFLEDGEIIRISPSSWQVFALEDLRPLSKATRHIDWDMQSAQKGGFRHFMLKEIFEQPRAIADCLAGRADAALGTVNIPELAELPVPSRLRIIACGTSFHAGLWAMPLLEEWARLPTCVEIASEFRYRNPLLDPGETVLVISQSGETADTLAALRIAKERNCPTLGLCNVNGSSISRETDAVIYTQAGPEISVASTKALCSQMLTLLLLALYWGQRQKTLPASFVREALQALEDLPQRLEAALPALRSEARALARKYSSSAGMFFLGRGQSYPLALEGALKVKELSYIHAEGYAAGEMKHGPIALIEPDFPSFILAPHDALFAKSRSNLEEVQARGGPVIALTNPPQPGLQLAAGHTWIIPEAWGPLKGFFFLPALQFFSYEAATYLGKDVDQPRNLAKSVTVE